MVLSLSTGSFNFITSFILLFIILDVFQFKMLGFASDQVLDPDSECTNVFQL